MYTNSDGDRWWCRIDDKRLVVWGTDVQATATTRPGRDVTTLPWVLRRDEKLWLEANLARVQDER